MVAGTGRFAVSASGDADLAAGVLAGTRRRDDAFGCSAIAWPGRLRRDGVMRKCQGDYDRRPRGGVGPSEKAAFGFMRPPVLYSMKSVGFVFSNKFAASWTDCPTSEDIFSPSCADTQAMS